jgi:uncharacterized protein
MIPKFPKTLPVSFEIKETIRNFLYQSQPAICELSLGNIYVWLDIDRTEATLINDNLCLLLQPMNGAPYFLEPIGNHKLDDTVDACLDKIGRLSRVSENFVNRLSNVSKYQITPLPDQFDYVYLTQEMAELKGQKFDAKRNHIHKFKNKFPDYQCHDVTASFFEPAMILFQQWSKKIAAAIPTEFEGLEQRIALTNAFQHFGCCNFRGVYIESDGKVLGFNLGSKLNDNTFIIHFQFGLSEVPGIYQILLQEMCSRLQADFPLVNLESDLGIPGLRKMKLSYHPYKIEKKYEIISSPTNR